MEGEKFTHRDTEPELEEADLEKPYTDLAEGIREGTALAEKARAELLKEQEKKESNPAPDPASAS